MLKKQKTAVQLKLRGSCNKISRKDGLHSALPICSECPHSLRDSCSGGERLFSFLSDRFGYPGEDVPHRVKEEIVSTAHRIDINERFNYIDRAVHAAGGNVIPFIRKYHPGMMRFFVRRIRRFKRDSSIAAYSHDQPDRHLTPRARAFYNEALGERITVHGHISNHLLAILRDPKNPKMAILLTANSRTKLFPFSTPIAIKVLNTIAKLHLSPWDRFHPVVKYGYHGLKPRSGHSVYYRRRLHHKLRAGVLTLYSGRRLLV